MNAPLSSLLANALNGAVQVLADQGLLRRVECRVGRKTCAATLSAETASPEYEEAGRDSRRTVAIRIDTASGVTAEDVRRAGTIRIDGKAYEPESPAPDAGATGRWLIITAREKRRGFDNAANS